MAEGGEEEDLDLPASWFEALEARREDLSIVGDHGVVWRE
jgi:hypothetical protein